MMDRPLVVCGPSGTGKSTLLNRLFAAHPTKFGFSISHTTRSPRPGEVDGVNYHFTTDAAFVEMIQRGEFIENAQFSGNRYGTSVKAVKDVADQSRRCILDIDTQGVKLIKSNHPTLNPVFLFLSPPSLPELKKRLTGRGTETQDSLQKRLDAAIAEIQYAVEGGHDIVVVNDDVERAYGVLEKVALGEQVEGDKLPEFGL
ncbi:P-loop containing nucleoside triphosphate hydrolase protein [Filobasidium floriforme]|uniref:P-loop containing nucleoside triphosphate hydrolase protein n=1 Tax=Filobasidium floriforme TaxID=5210 RepID=UPI001E8CBE8A|nr:P-loop containing nucleoside triphosphate hydrolase protein [Filobasidium floriforme]KAH8078367.1 P-loop containing nucleoside triphosphate hydrolase protein [Filobasidium floriforme]